ncbi:MAG: hypothetical protein J3T61_08080, partial [Candidatus Brocadiales bacterium]|nr:hypothetical protein [Candidatus Bathyanammoxibius sp.]
MGEQAQQLPFRVVLQDDGSVKLQGFENKLRGTTRTATRSGGRMTRAFSRIGRSIKAVGRSVFSLKGLLIGLASGVVLRSFFGLLRAAGQQEDAINKLNSALRTAGVFTEAFSKQQQALASSLQAQTRFGDEAILVAQSLLITYGVTTDRLEEATRATLDFAAATGKDLNTAALTIGKAAAGFTGELGR